MLKATYTRSTEGSTEYSTCAGLLTTSSSTWPETALFQISANGVTLDKLVIGKPATSSDASNGYIDPSTLATCVSEAAGKGWGKSLSSSSKMSRKLTGRDVLDAGVMVWQVRLV
ncbi:hypothetical protein J3R82DRAFT_10034 [Butyriboletus roseoflavus]|nr:hypothetical protein J3R82DRAFT_10034 [Butyriboletus roseoflavus]